MIALAMVALGLGGSVLVLTMFTDSRRFYAVTCLVAAVALAYNVTRFVPRARKAFGISPRSADVDRLVERTARWTGGWRPEMRLVLDPVVHEDDGVLVIGLSLLACLRESELAVLVRDAHEIAEPDAHRSVAAALRVVRGDLGRGLWNRTGRDAWLSRFMLRRIAVKADELQQARAEFAHAVRRGRGVSWDGVALTADAVAEAWNIVLDQWLAPALERGVWHPDPSTGLRELVAACESAGLLETPAPRLAGAEAVELISRFASYERALVEAALEEHPHDVEPTDWADHPTRVTVPGWRTTLAAGLEASRRATGQPQAATLGALIGLYEDGWGPSIAAVLTPGSEATEATDREATPPPATLVRQQL